jgi:hypothetical protein
VNSDSSRKRRLIQFPFWLNPPKSSGQTVFEIIRVSSTTLSASICNVLEKTDSYKIKGRKQGGNHITLARGESSRLADFASEVL